MIDPLTKEQFEPKRVNQKFASAKNRILFYNKYANELRQYESNIDKPLKKNHRILLKLLPGAGIKELVLHKQYLLGLGFSFNVHTSYEKHEGYTRSAIYRYTIVPLENEQIKILKK